MADILTKKELVRILKSAEDVVIVAHGCRDPEFSGPVVAAVVTEAFRNPEVMSALLEE